MQEVRAYRTTDGTLFDSEGQATRQELGLALRKALAGTTQGVALEEDIEALITDAEELSRLFLHYCNTNAGTKSNES